MTDSALTRFLDFFWPGIAPRAAPPEAARSQPRPSPSQALAQEQAAPANIGVFRLRTGLDTWLSSGPAEPAGHAFVTMSQTLDPATVILALVPGANRNLCFLLAPGAEKIAIRSDGFRGTAISAMMLQTNAAGIVRLKHPLSPQRYMGVTRPGQGGPEGWVIFDSLGRTMLDVFGLVPVQRDELPAPLLQAATELGRAATQPMRQARLMAQLRGGLISAGLMEPLLRVLPHDELALLARDLLEKPVELALLRAAMPENPWLQQALPKLAAWYGTRPPAAETAIIDSPPQDEFAGEPLEGFGLPQAGIALQALARRHVGPKHAACLLATARNEGAYLLDWISYHLSIGFEHIFLYTNDNEDGSDALLERLARHGAMTLIRNARGPNLPPQYKAYAHALLLLPQILDYRWTAVLDVDEYLAFDTAMFRSVIDFLSWQETQPVDAIALCWLLFAAGESDVWSDLSTPLRFTRRDRAVNRHVKSVFRTNKFWHAQAHFPHSSLGAPFVFRTETGLLHHHQGVTNRDAPFAERPSAAQAWINHYLLRTAQEALWKMARGRGDLPDHSDQHLARHAGQVCSTFLKLARVEETVEDIRIQACRAGQGAVLESLLALPGVAEADSFIKAHFADRLTRATRAFLDAGPGQDEAPPFAKFRGILAAQAG